MNQDNNTLVQNNSNAMDFSAGLNNAPLPAAPTVGVQTIVAPVAEAQASDQVATNSNILICPKCGSEMRKDSRYCMKCGNLNYAHPDNESMKQYAWQSIKQGNFIPGANVNNKYSFAMIESISNFHPFKRCFTTNILLHLLLGVGLFLVFNAGLASTGGSIPVMVIIGIVIGIIVSFIANYSVQAMFIKAGEPWWGYFVPFYNNYILYKIAMGNGWLFLTLLIPIVGEVLAFIMLYNLGKKFYKNGWLTLFFPYVMIPIIAFDKKSEYSMLAKEKNNLPNAIDANGKTQSEKAYGRKKFFITLIVIVVLAVIIYLAWPYLVPIVEKIYNMIMDYVGTIK